MSGDLVQVKVDHVVLSRTPGAVLGEAVAAGLKRTNVETALAFETQCVTDGASTPSFDLAEMLARGILVARAGAGFPAAVHLERFASPARLCVTDDPRLAGVGGAAMLSLVVAQGQLVQALTEGTVWLRPPRSVQVLLTGRVRPFVCARDVALELMRRGLSEVVRRVEAAHRAPVVLEFAGPSTRLLSVGERSVLAGLAPQLGAAAALFTSDERTEVFLRDQRRSKAHRALSPDAGAPCDEVVNLDLGAVDPLLLDETGRVRAVRDLAGAAVSQVVLGGDSGVTLRDLFAAATLLKAKRVPAGVDFLLAVPSRQMLETLSGAGALSDLLATGARLIEPDARVMEGTLYPPRSARTLSARTCDPEPLVAGAAGVPFVVASAETLAYAVATGEIGDPRSFKRPVRVTVPRALPTDDVLVVRERRSAEGARKAAGEKAVAAATTPLPPTPWKGPQTLDVIDASTLLGAKATNGKGSARVAVLCGTLDEVRRVASRAPTDPHVGAVLSSFIPSGVVAQLSGVGVAALEIEESAAKSLQESGPARSIALPAPGQWRERAQTPIALAGAGAGAKLTLTWLALGVERTWATLGTAAPTREAVKAPRPR